MKDFGEVPGGSKVLKPLLFPFHLRYPKKLWSKYRWFRNSNLAKVLPDLNRKKKWISVIDRLGAPGDALITSTVIRNIKSIYPNLKCNCITPHAYLLKADPHIDTLNQSEHFYSFDSSYWELIVQKNKNVNVVRHNMSKLGISDFEYKAKFYLTTDEKKWAKKEIAKLDTCKPIFAICTKSKESVKNWPLKNWSELLSKLISEYEVIQLGDKNEPMFEGVKTFAGKISMRESAALLSRVNFFIGPDSLLMHIANGLRIPSVIIFGGSRPVECFGYDDNINLSEKPECSPCWIHDGYEVCEHDLSCLQAITVNRVLLAIKNYTEKNKL